MYQAKIIGQKSYQESAKMRHKTTKLKMKIKWDNI